MQIDFQQTLAAITAYRSTVARDGRGEDQTSAVMVGVCDDVIGGQYELTLTSQDAFSQSFLSWTRDRNLLVTA